jgi:hypothetical protein
VKVDVSSGEVTYLSDQPRVYTSFASSPNDAFLMVAWLQRPYSYAVPCGELGHLEPKLLFIFLPLSIVRLAPLY